MRICIIGTGYVGLVTGTCFAETGNEITCVDVDARKIEGLQRGVLPIYEPGLAELVERNMREGRLSFTTDLQAALKDRGLVFIAVGTPQSASGAADLRALWAVTEAIRDKADGPKVVIVKSTVPVGTNQEVLTRLNRGRMKHEAASNPEFLKEGHAIEDCLRPDRVVVGVRSEQVAEQLQTLYAPFLRSGKPFLVMTPESAEMTKYVANAMLATKISFINEMANLCEAVGADIDEVRRGIGYDVRIGFQFLHPGAGYGGSCFPKDVRAMVAMAENKGLPATILQAVDTVNDGQKTVVLRKLLELLGEDLTGKTVAVWGLAFKPGTDDVREAPALVLIRGLLEAGATVHAHDPEAIANTRALYPQVHYFDHQYEALRGCDALAIVTEWPAFRSPDLELMRRQLGNLLVVDGRNLYDPAQMESLGFTYASVGRQTIRPAAKAGTSRKAA
jgi:UDPglucose 6-dehydrogenase